MKRVLEIHHLEVRFGTRTVLKDVSFAVHEGEIVSLIGPNGAGKTTLFNVISGLVRASSGDVIFMGRPITGWAPHRVCRAGIARTFQIARPFPEMTAEENVLIAMWFGKPPSQEPHAMANKEKAAAWLHLVGLEEKRHTLGKELTLSEQRRLEVARALATRPSLLLLDEIAAGLSPYAVNQAAQLVQSLRERGMTILLVDHFLNLTARVSDRLVALDQGEKIVEGSPQEVLHHPEVLSAYLGERERADEA
ncbi:MAG: ABC transporter ATP-binding protein [Desulfosoma sp.]|uniref:ABC transporter ATP-binding protein n=1 Tax=Desulfosoma sp. TaxID=2603217 RepID=UPI00404B45B2